jgi:antitoxin HicB
MPEKQTWLLTAGGKIQYRRCQGTSRRTGMQCGAPAEQHSEMCRFQSAQTTAQEVIMGKKSIGSSFDDFLAEEALLEESTAVAMKRVIAWQIAQEMKAQQMTKTDLAKRMHTSRAALNRLLDENDGSLTLTTLASAAAALGKRVNLQLVPA